MEGAGLGLWGSEAMPERFIDVWSKNDAYVPEPENETHTSRTSGTKDGPTDVDSLLFVYFRDLFPNPSFQVLGTCPLRKQELLPCKDVAEA